MKEFWKEYYKVETVDLKSAILACYDLTYTEISTAQYNASYKLSALFDKHKSDIATGGGCYMPKSWAPLVLTAIEDLIVLNENIKFVDIKEQNAKLVINFHYPEDYDINIHKCVHRIKNVIDKLVHIKIRRFEVVRKFNYDAIMLH